MKNGLQRERREVYSDSEDDSEEDDGDDEEEEDVDDDEENDDGDDEEDDEKPAYAALRHPLRRRRRRRVELEGRGRRRRRELRKKDERVAKTESRIPGCASRGKEVSETGTIDRVRNNPKTGRKWRSFYRR